MFILKWLTGKDSIPWYWTPPRKRIPDERYILVISRDEKAPKREGIFSRLMIALDQAFFWKKTAIIKPRKEVSYCISYVIPGKQESCEYLNFVQGEIAVTIGNEDARFFARDGHGKYLELMLVEITNKASARKRPIPFI